LRELRLRLENSRSIREPLLRELDLLRLCLLLERLLLLLIEPFPHRVELSSRVEHVHIPRADHGAHETRPLFPGPAARVPHAEDQGRWRKRAEWSRVPPTAQRIERGVEQGLECRARLNDGIRTPVCQVEQRSLLLVRLLLARFPLPLLLLAPFPVEDDLD